MKLYDLHTHTTMSDGSITLQDLVEQENQLGRILGVSDHLFCCGIYTMSDVSAYLEALKPYAIYRGAEVNMEHNYALPDELDMQLDYVIASVHSMPDGKGGLVPLSEYFCKRSGVQSYYHKNYSSDLNRWYLAHILRMVEKTFSTQRVDIYGHATVLPVCDELYGTKFLLDWENAVLALCKKYGVALEISGLWRAPNMEMLRRAKAMGITFSSGSDCHKPTSIGVMDYVDLAVDTLGLSEDDFFRPARKLA
ncbi:MAG: PHP domain-containing protein [Clostridia bacterium]